MLWETERALRLLLSPFSILLSLAWMPKSAHGDHSFQEDCGGDQQNDRQMQPEVPDRIEDGMKALREAGQLNCKHGQDSQLNCASDE